MSEKVNVLWFKRDLRISDHKSLFEINNKNIPFIPIYVFEEEYWKQPFASFRHWHFINDCLHELRSKMSELGNPLIVRQGNVLDSFTKLAKEFEIENIFAHEETGNDWTYKRDLEVISWCKNNSINFIEHPSNL